MNDILTPEDRQALHDARCASVDATIASLPEYARLLALKYRRHIELCGRLGPCGSAIGAVEEFVGDISTAFQAHEEANWQAFLATDPKPFGHIPTGSGV